MAFTNKEGVYQHPKPPYDAIKINTVPRRKNEDPDQFRAEVSHALGRMTTGGGGEYNVAGK
ncbi:MAG: hypothetical protein KGI73_04110 [Patescibacteria group bacterium]|nr:hypothetical protein [Patescibacteria group bacterium]